MDRNRPVLTDTSVIDALAHPVRLDVLRYLMSNSPATASACARAVGDSPSNCSYHLRTLAKHGLVEPDESGDGRERPWRATVTGFGTADGPPGSKQARSAAALLASSIQLDQRLVRQYLAGRDTVDPEWRGADQFSAYALRVTPGELTEIGEALDAVVRPYLAATRDDPPADAADVHVGLHAFRRAEQA